MVIKSKEVLQGLSRQKLKSYIFYLTQQYYAHYREGDVDGFDRAIEQLFFILEEYGDTYVNIDGFMCFCMYVNANVELMKANEEQAFALDPLFKMDLLEEDVEELPFDIKNIFNKERIKERYYEKRTRELIE